MPRQVDARVWAGRLPRYTGSRGFDTSTNAVPVERPTRAYSRPVNGSVQPQTSLPLPSPISGCGRKDIRSMSRHGYGPAMPSEHAASSTRERRWTGWTSALCAHPHEQRRPLASSGQMPPLHAQWDPSGGSGRGMPAARASAAAAGEYRTSAMAASGATTTARRVPTCASVAAMMQTPRLPTDQRSTRLACASSTYRWTSAARRNRCRSSSLAAFVTDATYPSWFV